MNHRLKTLPAYFAATIEGRKAFEIRDNSDRDFNAGDTATLVELNPAGNYTGREHRCEITYVTGFEQKPGWVVFGHRPIAKERA